MIQIIDYEAGNAASVLHAVNRIGLRAGFARRPEDLKGATHIILPGVGAARSTLQSLGKMGMIDALNEAVLDRKVFFLGICIGLQILFEHSEEEDTDCLGWLKGGVMKFDVAKVRVPQIGWNEVRFIKDAAIQESADYFYFVNSYRAKPQDDTDIWGVCDYNGEFAAAVQRDNIYATQFHAEKSGEAGLNLLRGFLSLTKGGGAVC